LRRTLVQLKYCSNYQHRRLNNESNTEISRSSKVPLPGDFGGFISIIMPAYNAAAHISESIASVLQQTYEHWELIIINDGSTDETAGIAKCFAAKDPRIIYIEQANGKQGKARNAGIKIAKGTLIAFLDADDLWMKDKLKQQLAFINLTNADLVFSDVTMIDIDGKTKKDTWGVKQSCYKGEEGVLAFLQGNKAPLLSVLAKKKSVISAGYFAESDAFQYGEDYDLWFRMLQQGSVFNGMQDKLAAYRQHAAQGTLDKSAMLQIIDTLKKINITNNALQKEKNKALKLWIRRFIKTNLQAINKNDLKKIVSLFPSGVERFFFSIINAMFSARLAAKIILAYSRHTVYNVSDNLYNAT
jgi:teichuronic acid biosynthesis glycosyltransferase TuaG